MFVPCADDRTSTRARSTIASVQGVATRGPRDNLSPRYKISTSSPVPEDRRGAIEIECRISAAASDRRLYPTRHNDL